MLCYWRRLWFRGSGSVVPMRVWAYTLVGSWLHTRQQDLMRHEPSRIRGTSMGKSRGRLS